ncbi:cell division protein FtsZ [Acrasis kona]|uniref:Cell division protein FtsZ n=1 Tax=Acrasis kona TaxID=1008807 RepID=A0AAW2YLC5_9EUKA
MIRPIVRYALCRKHLNKSCINILYNKRWLSSESSNRMLMWHASQDDESWAARHTIGIKKSYHTHNEYDLETPKIRQDKVRISVVGVGGGGSNTVDNMIQSTLNGVDFFVCNTDAQALERSTCENKIQIGAETTGGLGSGAQPNVGRRSAEESVDSLLSVVGECHMMFICAGMGGGTGTGAAPVIAAAAKKRGTIVVAVVTTPFEFEGNKRMNAASEGIKDLERSVDTLIVVPNENIFNIAGSDTPVLEAFKMSDQVLLEGVRGITDIMVKPGLINLDFADVKTIMQRGGRAFMGTGFGFHTKQKSLDTFWDKQQKQVAERLRLDGVVPAEQGHGVNRGKTAALGALYNPLLDSYNISQSENVLLSITASKNITLFEIQDISNAVRQRVGKDTNMIIGTTFSDPNEDAIFQDGVKVSVVITGIPRGTETVNRVSLPITPRVEHIENVVKETIVEPTPPQQEQQQQVGQHAPLQQNTPTDEREGWFVRFIKKHW